MLLEVGEISSIHYHYYRECIYSIDLLLCLDLPPYDDGFPLPPHMCFLAFHSISIRSTDVAAAAVNIFFSSVGVVVMCCVFGGVCWKSSL